MEVMYNLYFQECREAEFLFLNTHLHQYKKKKCMSIHRKLQSHFCCGEIKLNIFHFFLVLDPR